MKTSGSLTIAQLIATSGGNWGGMEKHTADLSHELARRGHTVHVLAHRAYQQRFSATVNFHPLPVQWGRRNPLLKLQLKQVLRKLSPDILHAQGNKAAGLLSRVGEQKSITVGTVHGTKSSHKDFRKLAGVICVSKGILRALAHPNTKLIHNGIPPQSNDDTTTHPLPRTQAFALATGRLEPVKQFEHLICAWAALKPPLPLFILGSGSETARLGALVQELGADDLVKLPGYERNPTAWLRRASLCVISSEREGFPYVLVEALLARCPVLSTPVNGALDLLPAESIAHSTRLDDLQALLSEHLPDLESLKASQQVCFENASQELTLEAMASRTEEFYYELLTGAPLA